MKFWLGKRYLMNRQEFNWHFNTAVRNRQMSRTSDEWGPELQLIKAGSDVLQWLMEIAQDPAETSTRRRVAKTLIEKIKGEASDDLDRG